MNSSLQKWFVKKGEKIENEVVFSMQAHMHDVLYARMKTIFQNV